MNLASPYFRAGFANANAEEPHEPLLKQLRALAPRRPLSDREALQVADQQAALLLRALGIEGPAVDDGLLRDLPFVTVTEQRGFPTSGMASKTALGWVVVLNGDEPVERRRFTLAHELKHIIDDPIARQLYPTAPGVNGFRRVERFCDHFAAALLMPAPWLRRDWLAGRTDVRGLAQRYRVSPRAMDIRLQVIGLVPRPARCPIDRANSPKFPGQNDLDVARNDGKMEML